MSFYFLGLHCDGADDKCKTHKFKYTDLRLWTTVTGLRI